MGRLTAYALVLAVALVAVAPVATPKSQPEVRIAVIDTGIDAAHPEFARRQLVAWWDFTDENLPAGANADPFARAAKDRAWDPWRAPYDPAGHGTAVASLAAGLNAGRCDAPDEGADKMSFAPGAELIVAKVAKGPDGWIGNASGDGGERMGRAIRWAVEQGADVITISIGAPWPHHLNRAEIEAATDAGVLVLASANYGPVRYLASPGSPYVGVSWMGAYGNHPDVLLVGAGLRTHGTVVTEGEVDPDVISWGYDACAALVGGGYSYFTGTSFATPLVAGMAAGAMREARLQGLAMDGEGARALLLAGASNFPTTTYAKEGLGYLLDGEWATIAAHARAGTLPDYAAQGDHAKADMKYHAAKKAASGAYPDVPYA